MEWKEILLEPATVKMDYQSEPETSQPEPRNFNFPKQSLGKDGNRVIVHCRMV